VREESPEGSAVSEPVRSEYRSDGLYAFGPASMRCALAFLVYFTFCAVSAATPEGERRRRVVEAGRDEIRKRERDQSLGLDYEPVRPQIRSGHPFYARPLKPATSGRKKKAA